MAFYQESTEETPTQDTEQELYYDAVTDPVEEQQVPADDQFQIDQLADQFEENLFLEDPDDQLTSDNYYYDEQSEAIPNAEQSYDETYYFGWDDGQHG